MRGLGGCRPELVSAVTWDEAIRWLFTLERRGVKLDLGRMRDCLEDLGRPQDSFASILVAGTNGKGSTSATLFSALSHRSRRVGLYTSPHLLDYRERIRLGGALASRAALLRRIEEDREIWERHELSFFEATTALAFSFFRDAGVEIAVLEVGLGGRLDATNTVEPVLSVITSLGMDHANLLGDTPAAIAREKAGILRPGVPVAFAGGSTEAIAAVRDRAVALGSPYFLRRACLRVDQIAHEGGDLRFRLRRRGEAPDGFDLPEAGLLCRSTLRGTHQVGNTALAVLALSLLRRRGLPITDEEMIRGIGRLRWSGRLERPVPGLPLLADVAHNREGARVVTRYVESLARRREIRPVIGMVDHKDHFGFFRELRRITREVRLVPLLTDRAAPLDDLVSAAETAGLRVLLRPSVAEGVSDALIGASEPGGPLVLVSGSFHTLEEAYLSLHVVAQEQLWSDDDR
jgi:dihydrofolate synthase / folylpolyglutamate synthase